jgi:hypothetical protein
MAMRLALVSNAECRKALHTQINTLANVSTSAFPGPVPVSLSRSDLWKLVGGRTRYVVSPKTDGIRMVLVTLVHQDQMVAALCNRARTLYFAEVTAKSSFFRGTLLDGEYLPDKGIYLVFDCFAFNGILCTQLDYLSRLRVAAIALSALTPSPSPGEAKSQLQQASTTLPLQMRIKPVFDLRLLGHLIKNVLPKLDYATDGLVFTPMAFESGALHPGPDPDLLKWKPLHDQTFDFKLLVEPLTSLASAAAAEGLAALSLNESSSSSSSSSTALAPSTAGTPQGLSATADYTVSATLWACVFVERTQQYQDVLQGQVHMSADAMCTRLNIQEPQEADRKVCEANRVGTQYNLLKLREDKTNPNTVQTVRATLKNIEEDITIEELIQLTTPKPMKKYVPAVY